MNRQKLITLLGWLGILPFLIALSLVVRHPELGLRVFSLYSLAILAFLAGSWWSSACFVQQGAESQRNWVVLLSNLIVLAALAAVLLMLSMPMTVGLLALAALYLGVAGAERQLDVFAQQPDYYRKMRLAVSTVVALLHVLCWLKLSGFL